MELVDTHCHLDFDAFSRDRDAVIADARKVGVSRFVIPAVKQATWDSLIKLCNQNQDLYYALGLHPVFIAEHNPAALREIAESPPQSFEDPPFPPEDQLHHH